MSRREEGALGAAYGDGEEIVAQGTPGDCMYVVQSGQVEVVHVGGGGSERVLGTLSAGDFFGEMAIFESEVRSATVRAVGEARVLKIDKKTLLRRIKEDPLLAVNLLRELSSRLREANAVLSTAEEARP